MVNNGFFFRVSFTVLFFSLELCAFRVGFGAKRHTLVIRSISNINCFDPPGVSFGRWSSLSLSRSVRLSVRCHNGMPQFIMRIRQIFSLALSFNLYWEPLTMENSQQQTDQHWNMHCFILCVCSKELKPKRKEEKYIVTGFGNGSKKKKTKE